MTNSSLQAIENSYPISPRTSSQVTSKKFATLSVSTRDMLSPTPNLSKSGNFTTKQKESYPVKFQDDLVLLSSSSADQIEGIEQIQVELNKSSKKER